MRKALAEHLLTLYERKPFIFLTGDIGFMAFEELQSRMGPHFINAGVAEQNMVSVAAGMAREGWDVWVYSIAPFLYARALEQIRNDICLHQLPVKLIGNGGGYGYGVMGPTHHALEDYGILLTLQHMNAYIPAFADDVEHCVQAMNASANPTYLRLGRSEKPANVTVPAWAPFRKLLAGDKGVVITVGPIGGVVWSDVLWLPENERPALWSLSYLEAGQTLPETMLRDLNNSPYCVVMEEHVQQGGAGQALAAQILKQAIPLRHFSILAAKGYPGNTYGSQDFHRAASGLTTSGALSLLKQAMNEG